MSRRKTLVRVSVVATVLLCVGPGAVEGQFISPNAAAVSYDSPTVTVTGTAEEYAAPDRAIIHLELVSREATAEAAALANGSARSAVRERLIALGVPADDIGLWGVGTGGARSDFGPPRGGAESAFESRSGLRVELSDLERLDPVIATSLLAGASVSRVELEAHQRAEVEARVTAAAVREARASAEAMA